MSIRVDPAIVTQSLTQLTGNYPITLSSFSRNYQVTVVPSSGATGTIKFSIQAYDDGTTSSDYEFLIDAATSAQQQVDLSSVKSFSFSGLIKRLRAEPDTVVGSYKVIIQQTELL